MYINIDQPHKTLNVTIIFHEMKFKVMVTLILKYLPSTYHSDRFGA